MNVSENDKKKLRDVARFILDRDGATLADWLAGLTATLEDMQRWPGSDMPYYEAEGEHSPESTMRSVQEAIDQCTSLIEELGPEYRIDDLPQ